MITTINIICWLVMGMGCSKNSGGTAPQPANHAPLASLVATITNVNPFSAEFKVTASDADNDALTYKWNFGEGTTKDGAATETFTYADNKTYTIKVAVSDGKAPAVNLTATVNTTVTTVTINDAQKFQTIEGFGGFGAQDVYWSNGPFTSPGYIDRLVNELGTTIIRDELPTSFEITNDNSDPYITDLSKYNLNTEVNGMHKPLGQRLQFFKDARAAGVEKFIVSVWSAPPWMKTNNRIDNGTTQNSAPPYNPSATTADNQLRTDMYEEFAEMCVAYAKIFKQQVGIDLYALSIQNEPRFSQSYQSCIYNGEALRDLLKVVGKRFKDEGLTTKLFLPEDIGWLGGVESMIKPSLIDADARQYADIVAVHGYDLNGVTPNSPDALTWQTMYGWGAAYGKPLWMTETSGYTNDWAGAMALSKAIYTALNFGNVSAWLYWTSSTGTLDEYCLMSSSGEKSNRYYVSENFYRYIRPGAVRISAQAGTDSKIYTLAFKHAADQATTIVVINDNAEARTIKLFGAGLPAQFTQYNTTVTDNCKDAGAVNSSDNILLPANSVVTLYHKG